MCRSRSRVVWIVVVWASACVAEGDAGPAVDAGGLPPFDAGSCVDPGAVAVEIEAEAVRTGSTNNVVVIERDEAFVVQSGENTVGRLELASGRWEPTFVDVGEDRGPWDVSVSADYVYVSNYTSATVTVARRSDGVVLGEVAIEAVAPSGVLAVGELVLVGSSGFVGPEFEEAQVVVLRALAQAPWLEAVGVIPASAKNTSELVFDAVRQRIYVVNTGARGFDAETGEVIVASDGSVDVLELAALEAGALEEAVVAQVPLRRDPGAPFSGGPRTLVLGPGGRYGYVPSAASPYLYKLDLDALVWARGAEAPIVAYLGSGNQLTSMAMRSDGLAWVVAYNQDAAYLFDPGCDASIAGPFDVGTGPLLEGALDVAWDGARGQALVLLSVSSAVTRLRDAR